MSFLKFCTNSKFDILILIETHHKQLDDIPSRLHIYKNNYHILDTEAIDGDPYAGIVVLINNRFTLTQNSVLLPGRLLNFKIKDNKEEYNVTALYGYTGKNASAAKIKLFRWFYRDFGAKHRKLYLAGLRIKFKHTHTLLQGV